MGNKIEIENLKKSFKNQVVLRNVSVNFEAGKIHGIIGRNGSGKTVLFKILAGFLIPDSGQIVIDGIKMDPTMKREMGILIEKPGFLDHLDAFKNLSLLASIQHHINNQDIRAAITAVGLDPSDKKPVGKYSLGMRQRLGIAQAIMEKPSLLILDEPMSGLDKNGVAEMRKLFLQLKESGITILLSSHYAEDIDALCDTVCEMDRGELTRLN